MNFQMLRPYKSISRCTFSAISQSFIVFQRLHSKFRTETDRRNLVFYKWNCVPKFLRNDSWHFKKKNIVLLWFSEDFLIKKFIILLAPSLEGDRRGPSPSQGSTWLTVWQTKVRNFCHLLLQGKPECWWPFCAQWNSGSSLWRHQICARTRKSRRNR